MAEPALKGSYRKPSFLWQGVLILAPVLILASIGAYALWKDQHLALHEAEARAKDLADEGAQRIWDELENIAANLPSNSISIEDTTSRVAHGRVRRRPNWMEFDHFGKLLAPQPYETVPVPHSLNENELNSDQRRLWNASHQPPSAMRDRQAQESHDRAAVYGEFLQVNPPPEFAAAAHFNRGLALAQSGQAAEAAEEFMTITNRYAGAFSESGLPLDLLARSHIQPAEEFSYYAVEHPCAMSLELIQRLSAPSAADVAQPRDGPPALTLWNEQEQLRGLAEAARPFFTSNRAVPLAGSPHLAAPAEQKVSAPGIFWMTVRDSLPAKEADHNDMNVDTRSEMNWLLIRASTANGFALLPRSELVVRNLAQAALDHLAKPKWLDFTVTLAGRELISTNSLFELQYVQAGKGSGQYLRRSIPSGVLPLLAKGRRGGEEHPLLSVSAMLISRDLLLAQQKGRTIWFAFLITVAASGSLIGFISAYRGFHKQHRLAEMKSNFVSGVSHELRAPIASIRLLAEGLERGKIAEPARQHEYFRFIVQECRRLSSMIENVLDFARIEQGRKQYEFEPVDVMALVEQTVTLMRPYAAERGVGVVSRNEVQERPEGTRQNLLTSDDTNANGAGGFIANIDGQAIQQALVNLVDNAIKHSPQGESVAITLRTDAGGVPTGTPSPAPRFYLSVDDHGPGIPAHERARIFERFYRLGSELRRETQGVGIGLSIVKHIVEAHRGTVRVESDTGKGSRFTMELPVDNIKNGA